MKCKQKRIDFGIFKVIICVLLCLLLLSSSFASILFAKAEDTTEIVYTDVLEDLQKDSSFDVSSYPFIETDYSLNVIQIAESVDKELFVYVYQPSSPIRELVGTSINISRNRNEDVYMIDESASKGYINYQLKLLNSNGVFYKYKVLDFVVSDELERLYNISNIFRAYDETIDSPAENGNVISEIGNAVGKLWVAKTVDGQIQYECSEIELITITSKYVGFVRYRDGFNLWPTSCDSHFVAFSTDKQIDKLKEADVYFTKQNYKYYDFVGGKKDYVFDEQVSDNYVHLSYSDKGIFEQDGLFSTTYEWDRITKTSIFIKDENRNNVYSCGIFNVEFGSQLTEEGKADLEGKDWILRFAETDYSVTYHSSGPYYVHKGTLIGDVSLLKLVFETGDKVYNLGVVDNKQTGDGKPDNENYVKGNLSVWSTVLLIVLGIILCLVFAPWIFQFLIKIIWFVLKAIWWLITAPFSIFKK